MHVEVRDDCTEVMVVERRPAHRPRPTCPSGTRRRAAPPRGRHPPRHVRQRSGPTAAAAGVGLAGYEGTQEGLAVLAEHLVGGLTAFRLRQLASRVVAVHRMLDGATFAEVFDALVDDGFPVRAPSPPTMRVFRSGGLTKDVVYLRGLVDLLAHLGAGGTLDPLWLGKLLARDLPDRRPRWTAALLDGRRASCRDICDDRQAHARLRTLSSGQGPRRPDRGRLMHIGFVVNDVGTEQPEFTTTRLAMAARRWATRRGARGRRLLLRPRRVADAPGPAPVDAKSYRVPRAAPRTTSRSPTSSSDRDRRSRRAHDAQRSLRGRRRSARGRTTSGVLFGQLAPPAACSSPTIRPASPTR